MSFSLECIPCSHLIPVVVLLVSKYVRCRDSSSTLACSTLTNCFTATLIRCRLFLQSQKPPKCSVCASCWTSAYNEHRFLLYQLNCILLSDKHPDFIELHKWLKGWELLFHLNLTGRLGNICANSFLFLFLVSMYSQFALHKHKSEWPS